MYEIGLLCVPEAITKRVLSAHHCLMGHSGVARFCHELKRRFKIFDSINITKLVQEIRLECRVCQGAEPPNENMKSPIHYNAVMEGFMNSICVDIFDMPTTIWMDQVFDHRLILCG